jgi:hypothetical protein
MHVNETKMPPLAPPAPKTRAFHRAPNLLQVFHSVETFFHGVENFFHSVEKSTPFFPQRG